jgi:hypothetical protein
MEGGQKHPINLEAGLDIKSSDMLVPVGQTTFQHNWQRYQGKCLPNSLRFEKNGWAAGWNVYNFDYSTFRKDYGAFWLGVKDFNMYTKELNIYATERSFDSLASIRVVPESKIIAGDVSIAGNVITGRIKGKQYQLSWDSDNHIITSITSGFIVEQTNNSDYSTTVKVIDEASQVALDFELLTPGPLTGDSVSQVNYTGFNGTVHSWSNYTYNPVTGNVYTPEGVDVIATLSGNQISFDYQVGILDETINTDLALSPYYVEFNNCYVQDFANKEKFIFTAAPSPATMSCNNYQGSVNPKDLVVRDPDGIVIDYALPVWLTILARPDRPTPETTKCNNCKHDELLVFLRNYPANVPVKVHNVFTDNTVDIVTNKDQRFLNQSEYRFNQIFIGNTIHKPDSWHWSKYKIPTEVWNAENRQYTNFRNKNTALMNQYLGNIYTWGTFTFSMVDLLDYNKDPVDVEDETNLFYTKSDISGVYSIKKKGDPDTEDSGDDFAVAQDAFDESTIDLSKLIVKEVATTEDYDSAQEAQTYNQLYSGARFIGTTYEDASTDDNWPFSRIPKFNYVDPAGEETVGVYYVYPDKTTVITDVESFMDLVRGTFDPDLDPKNELLLEDTLYNRTREVRTYNTCYDFDFIHQEEGEDQSDWNERRDAWNAPWQKYYRDITSPIDFFDWHATWEDPTYRNYTDIVVTRTDAPLRYVVPGQYMIDKYSLDYNNDMGVILHEPAVSPIKAEVFHNTIDATSRYNINSRQTSGKLSVAGLEQDIWDYFGPTRYFQGHYSNGNAATGWIQSNQSTTLESSGFKVGVNYDFHVIAHYYEKESDGTIKRDEQGNPIETVRDLGINDDTLFDEDAVYHTITWVATEMADNNWVDQMLFEYRSGIITTEDYRLNDKLDPLSSDGHETKHGDQNDGVFYCVPLLGHTASRITYPNLKDATKINDDDSFVIEKVPDDQLENPDKLYLDREGGINELMFNIVKSSVEADKSDGTGAYRVQAESANETGSIFYTILRKDNENNEIYWDWYVTGLCYGAADNQTGHMSILKSDFPVMEVIWAPKKYDLPITCTAKFSNNNTKGSAHKFYNNAAQLLAPSVTCDPGAEFDFEDLFVPIHFTLTNGATWTAKFDARTGVITCDENPVLCDTSSYTVNAVSTVGLKNKAVTALSIVLLYANNKAKIPQLLTAGYTLTGADTETVSFDYNSKQFKYSYSGLDMVSPRADTQAIVNNDLHHVIAQAQDQDIITIYMPGVYEGRISGTIVTFEYNGSTYTFDLNELVGKSTDVDVTSVDVRRPHITKNIGRLKQQGNYQLVRQAWNSTVEVENFWWVDSKHILELNQTHFVLKRNTGELDDWNGNRFEKIYEKFRSIVLPSSVIRHFVPCAYNCTRAVPFISAEIVNGLIELKLYDIRDEMSLYSTINIQVKVRELGTKLNAEQYSGNRVIFNSYNPINEDFVLSKAKWSATLVNNDYLIIGCHVGNNYDQWSFVYNITNKSIVRVIQGYGFVSAHGDLTGGMLPNDYCDTAIGFNGTVQPLSALDRADRNINDLDKAYEISNPDDFSKVKTMIAGTAEQQWYIQQRLYGIVSHMTFDGAGGFVKQIIPMTNNYAAKYKSPSWSTTVMGDMCIQVQPFATMVKFPQGADVVWNMMMGFIGYPSIYMIAPRYSYCIYLQQTLGQYAYVHYNSSKSLPEEELGDGNTDSGMSEKKNIQTDPVLSGYLTFDKQKATQRAESNNNYYQGGILAILISAFSAAAQTFEMKPSLNEEQNQSAVSDTGKKFLDNMVANTGDMLASALVTQAKTDSGVTSTVTAIKSLDMFYSTSEQQHIYAGPGFVEHQFVADCVAQSVTDTQAEGKVLQMQYIIRALTELQLNIQIKLELLAAEALIDLANAIKETSVCGTNVGGAAAAVSIGIANGLKAAAAAQEMAAIELAKVMDVLCANGITVSVDAQLQRHALSAEGKHKYGEKNESFMWPCWGVNPGQLKYTDEWVGAGIKNTPWILALRAIKYFTDGSSMIPMSFNPCFYNENVDYSSLPNVSMHDVQYNGTDDRSNPGFWRRRHEGLVDFYQASPFGLSEERTLPNDMAKVEGVSSFLPRDPFKNENIGMSEPAFTPSLIQDYIIDKAWDLGQCCTYGLQQWVTCKDTKITNCAPSNMYITGDFCGIAVPYMAMEIKRGITKEYMRPWAITPTVLAFNVTGYNSILDDKLYHSFDGLSQRIVDLVGSPGLNKNRQSYIYAFQINDRFKRSNIVPANELQGNFEADPVMAMNTIDPLFLLLTVASKEKGLEGGTIGEDKDTARWALPIFTEHVTTLPAAVKTLTAMPLNVYDGVTGLTTNLANNQTAYKAPLSVDFTIGKNVYRQTEEYICSVQTQGAIDIVTELVPSLGLKFIGATPTEAYFYSKATRCYYMFSGGSSLTKMDMMERFRDIQKGYWDFVNQEVIMPCLMTFKRLNPEVLDKDSETDNIIVPVLSRAQVSGELIPPITTIFNDRSWYKCVSLPCGFAYQGPNRVIINRSVFVEYMLDSMKSNFGKWKKMDREKYTTKRIYPETYKDVVTDVKGVDGWTHNPFLLVTSALGVEENTDCMFEWTLTFCWPIEMDLLYGVDNYAVVNVMADTMTPGGKRQSRPTHIFLTKELFTRDGNYGYYSVKFQSKNGIGNRERLHIWSDQYIAISSITCDIKATTSNRASQLTQQLDVQKLKEL